MKNLVAKATCSVGFMHQYHRGEHDQTSHDMLKQYTAEGMKVYIYMDIQFDIYTCVQMAVGSPGSHGSLTNHLKQANSSFRIAQHSL